MKEQIEQLLKGIKNRAVSPIEIYRMLYGEGFDQTLISGIKKSLLSLQEEKKVYCTNTKKELFMISPYKKGKLILTKRNHGFVELEEVDGIKEEDIYIQDEYLNGALNGDKVLVKVLQTKPEEGMKKEGRIKEILERKSHTGEVITEHGKRYVKVNNLKIKTDIPTKVVDGTVVEVSISKKAVNDIYIGEIKKILGHKDDPNTDIKRIMVEYDFHEEWPEEVLEQLKKIPSSVENKDISSNRRDLRDKVIFTIDGDDTKDIDDAISIEKLGENHYKFGVHIADVTHYVKENSPLDKEAALRGTSAYLADKVVPMYPHELSNGICSLNPDVDRLAVSCEMEIKILPSGEAKIIASDVFESVIHSRKKMTYKEVNKILDHDDPSEDYKEFVPYLKDMHKISLALRKMKIKRGYLQFKSREVKIKLDEEGKPVDIISKEQGTGEELIEDFMLAANEQVTEFVDNNLLNFIYRVHDKPNELRLKEVLKVLKTYIGSIPETNKVLTHRDLQKILNEVNKNDKAIILNNLLLRCMAKAKYDVNNIGHYGIAAKQYCHFTSPIRRYPDTHDHRIIKSIIRGDIKEMERYTTKENLKMQEQVALHSSLKERNAMSCEKEVNKMEMAYFMQDKIDEEYTSTITGFSTNSVFVILQNLVEGKVNFSTMDDYYVYSPELEAIIGRKRKKMYRLGDQLDVKLIKASKDTREIDFEMVRKKRHRTWK